MSGSIRHFSGWQTTFRISAIQITAGGAGCKIPMTRPRCGSRPKIRHITGALPLSSAGSCCEPPSQTVTPILRGAVCIAAGKIWRLTCWLCIKTNYLFICPGLKNAAGKVTQGMTRPLLRHSKKQPKSAKRQQKRNPEKGAQNHEDQIISQGLVRSGLA